MASKQQLSVLVVDRDEGSNVQIKDVLTGEGHQTEVLNDPEQVVEAVKQGRFQMVILDVSPPERHGIELLERIRERAEGVPLYAVETVRMLLDRGLLRAAGDRYEPVGDVDELAVPETLQALIAARLDGLPAEERSLLQAASVLGKTFAPAAVADAFCASRLGGDGGQAFGTLPRGADAAAIVARAAL